MDRELARDVAVVAGRDGVVAPGTVAAAAAVLAPRTSVPFGTVVFFVFAAAVVVTGIAASSVASASTGRQGVFASGGADQGDRWRGGPVVRLALFDVGLAGVLTVHALWLA